MAWITNFVVHDSSGRVQPSQVTGFVKAFATEDGDQVLQIDTQGSPERENPGKQSQTIQIGREAARELFDILKRTYRFQ